MVSSDPFPWYNRAPRPFPAKEWLERRYGFRLPLLCCATPRAPVDAWAPRRVFPVKRWLDGLPPACSAAVPGGETPRQRAAWHYK